MMKKIFLAAVAAVSLAQAAPAGGAENAPAALAGSPVYSDPGFQDYVETAYGYLNPAARLKPAPVLRDAPASPCAAGCVRVSVTPAARELDGLLRDLAAAGFVFSWERTAHSASGSKLRLLGKARPESLGAIRRVRGAAAVRVYGGKKRRLIL
jgi:hypothetical protein